MFRLVLLTVIVALASGAFIKMVQPRYDGRIVGGVQVHIEDYPFQVSLQNGGHNCGGSFLSEKWIMTAAHCTTGYTDKPEMFQLRVGSSSHYEGGELLKIAKIYQHELYDENTIDYDFSILKLESPVTFDDSRQAVSLPEKDEDIEDGTILTVSGWGATRNPSESSDLLRATKVPKYNQELCNKTYSNYGGVTDRMICAGFTEGGKDSCQGDSGGPLTIGGKLVGVVSWGAECASSAHPGVYSRVAVVRDWIHKITNL